MESRLPTALIGVGGIGAFHLRFLQELQRAGRVILSAVADPAFHHSAELRDKFESQGVRWYTDQRQMLQEEPAIEAVTIAAPIPFHFEMVGQCLDRGLIVNLEKPPVPLIQQLDALVARDTHYRVSVGFQGISSSSVRFLKEAIVAGRLGEIREIAVCASWPRLQSYYQRAGWAGKMITSGRPTFDGPATNALSHLIHATMYLASSRHGEFEQPVEIRGELYRARPIESYDLACFRGRLSNNVSFFGVMTHAAETQLPFQIEVRGSLGSAKIRDDGTVLESEILGTTHYPEKFPNDLGIYYDRFVDFATGLHSRPISRLRDTRGYVLATNGLLISSGGIHDISPEYVRRFSRDGDEGFAVLGLVELMEEAFDQRLLFSELEAPWARKTPTQNLYDLRTLDLTHF